MVEQFNLNGWTTCAPFSSSEVSQLQEAVAEVQNWPDTGDWLHYREMTDHGPKLCRTENFVPFHPVLKSFLAGPTIVSIVSDLMGEQASLYKEKINYKLSGGAGFAPHQDAPAYPFIETSISCMIAIDASTIENGCLEVVDGQHHAIIEMDDQGCINKEWVSQHQWHSVEMNPGDVLFFHSHTPHRSGPNLSASDRRAIYPTFNALAEGDLRQAYYEEKLRIFRETKSSGTSVRLSLINDFQGRPV